MSPFVHVLTYVHIYAEASVHTVHGKEEADRAAGSTFWPLSIASKLFDLPSSIAKLHKNVLRESLL